jgi:hypothetical protein
MLRLVDNRNADPAIFRKARIAPQRAISVGFEVKIPDVDDLEPTPVAEGFVPRQAFNFVVFGEKASLESVLLPIARAKQADLYLPTGEISDTLLHRIARDADEDGRPLVVFTVSDCDPAGYQMPISIARKLKAFRDLLFLKLKFEVVVGLTPKQVRELNLPSTPLKEGESEPALGWKHSALRRPRSTRCSPFGRTRCARWSRTPSLLTSTTRWRTASTRLKPRRVPQLKGGEVTTNYTSKVPVVAAHDQTTTGKSVSINGGQYGQRQTEVKDPPAGEG